jgi:hypothetical protein
MRLTATNRRVVPASTASVCRVACTAPLPLRDSTIASHTPLRRPSLRIVTSSVHAPGGVLS